MVWNIRVVNDQYKFLAIANKCVETGGAILYLQETKQELYDKKLYNELFFKKT